MQFFHIACLAQAMSFQPLITSAFSSYAVGGRSFYADSIRGAQRDEQTEKSVAADLGQVGVAQGTPLADAVSATSSVRDADADKPKSASGDVLDLSTEAKQLAEKSEKSVESNSSEKAVEQKQTPAREDVQAAEQKSEEKSEQKKAENQSADRKIELKSDDAKTETEAAELKSDALKSESDLTPEEQDQVTKLKARDAEVRQHEAAHLAAAGQYATSGASYTYQKGPDGNNYAIGGEVSISTGSISGDPEATLQKAQTIQRAALAPAEPSSQDQKVAAEAAKMAAQARMEIAQQQSEQGQAAQEESQQGLQTAANAQDKASGNQASASTNSASTQESAQNTASSSIARTASTFSPSSNYASHSSMSSGNRSAGFSAYA